MKLGTKIRNMAAMLCAFGAFAWAGTAQAQDWSALGTGISSFMGGLQTSVTDAAGNLYIGGGFKTAGGVACNGIAKWDGSAWSALGVGVETSGGSGIVNSMAFDATGNLYVVGSFTYAGGYEAYNIAK